MRKSVYVIGGLLGFVGALYVCFNQVQHSVHAKSDSPLVIELFTSQSCSSCPPADKLLGELAQQENVIALSCSVTYWNHLRWKDTLAKQFCTDRQRAYNDAIGRRGVFTPQMIVNGEHSAVGSRHGEVRSAMAQTAPFPLKPIELSLQGQALRIQLPAMDNDRKATLYLVQYGDLHTQNIRSGENRGLTVEYTNYVQIIRPIGQWDGATKMVEIHIDSETDGYAVIAQQDKVGPIIAAGRI